MAHSAYRMGPVRHGPKSTGPKRSKLTEAGLNRLLRRCLTANRDLTASIETMWTRLKPHLRGRAATDDRQMILLGPVQRVELITAEVLHTLQAREGVRPGSAPRRGKKASPESAA
jgi:hypothetical protein